MKTKTTNHKLEETVRKIFWLVKDYLDYYNEPSVLRPSDHARKVSNYEGENGELDRSTFYRWVIKKNLFRHTIMLGRRYFKKEELLEDFKNNVQFQRGLLIQKDSVIREQQKTIDKLEKAAKELEKDRKKATVPAKKEKEVKKENHSDRHSDDEGLAVHCQNSNLHQQF